MGFEIVLCVCARRLDLSAFYVVETTAVNLQVARLLLENDPQ